MGNSALDEALQYHIKVAKGDVGEYVILAGDPGRIPQISARFNDPAEMAYNREYCVHTGYLCGKKVSAVSTGIGGPSAAIAVEELIKCGAHTFIRVGTSGGMDAKVIGGDLVIATAAIRAEGTSREYIPIEYPAVADFETIKALEQSAQALSSDADGKRYHIGVIQSKDSFYGEMNPERMPVARALIDSWEAFLKCGCLISEMECAAIFSVGIAHKVRVGAVLTAIWNVEREKYGLPNPTYYDNNRAIDCAVGAIKQLIMDNEK